MRHLEAIGVGRRAVQHRVACGRLIRLRRGVYAVGHGDLTRHGRWMAAVLAAGPGAVLSHRSAAALLVLRVTEQAIEVTVPRQRTVDGLLVHVSQLPPDEIECVDGIAATTVARTLFDLAAVLTPAELKRAVNEAEYRQLTSPVGLPGLMQRHPRRHGACALAAILADSTLGDDVSETDLEEEFLAFVGEYALPRPVGHPTILDYEPDYAWPTARLIIELDGRATHRTTSRFESDRTRDRRLALEGWTVIRVTWRMLHLAREREALGADLLTLLSR